MGRGRHVFNSSPDAWAWRFARPLQSPISSTRKGASALVRLSFSSIVATSSASTFARDVSTILLTHSGEKRRRGETVPVSDEMGGILRAVRPDDLDQLFL